MSSVASSLLLSKICSDYGWIPKRRNYEEEISASKVEGIEVPEGPLAVDSSNETFEELELVATEAAPLEEISSNPLQNYDPLAVDNPLNVTINPEYDPLSQAAAEIEETPQLYSQSNENFTPWTVRKPSILKKYTTNERVSISVTFMENESSGPVDKVKERLEELEEAERGQEGTMKVSQQEYLDQIESMHNDLLTAWNDNQRVQALKIAIQCSKLLCDTSVIKFYPSKFVLITEILDTFGRLVFDRLRGRSVIYDSINAVPIPLPEAFKAEDVTPAARETCRNWFYKIASIREVLPRIYVEMALINCYRFLSNDTFVDIVKRIGMMLNGLGNPLVATYARAYLARKGHEVGCHQTDYLLSMFYAHIDSFIGLRREPSYKEQNMSRLDVIARKVDMKMPDYLDLYTPALEWILQCIGHNANQELLDVILLKYKETDNALVLDHILASFQSSFISPRALDFARLIQEANESYFPKYKLYRTLGENLVVCAPPERLRKEILNEIWSVVTSLTDTAQYMNIVEVFIEFPAKHCSLNELNIMLGDVLKHVKEGHAYSDFQAEIENIALGILENSKSQFTKIFNMDHFMPLVDLLYGEKQVKVNRAILESFCRDMELTTDPVLINAIFECGKIVHDSINSLSFEDEIRQIADLLAIFIKKIDYGMDLEKQLNFFVECRRAFGNLDAVKQSLVIVSVGLAMRTHQIIKGRHSKRTAAFVRSCIAFCFITIPSLDLVFPRLYLYLLAGQAALINQCIPQSETLFEAMISLVEDVPEYSEVNNQVVSTSEELLNFVSSFASELVVIPGHPTQGPLFLIKALIQVFENRNWERETTTRSEINLKLISMLCAIVQDDLPFHIHKVDSNDVLYKGDPAYQQEVQDVIDALLKLVLENMEEFEASRDASSQRIRAQLALKVFHHTIMLAQLNEKSLTLAVEMYQIAKGQSACAAKLKSCLEYLSCLPDEPTDSGVSFVAQLKAECK